MAYAVAGSYLARLRSLDPGFAWPGEPKVSPRKARRPEVETTAAEMIEALRRAFAPSRA